MTRRVGDSDYLMGKSRKSGRGSDTQDALGRSFGRRESDSQDRGKGVVLRREGGSTGGRSARG